MGNLRKILKRFPLEILNGDTMEESPTYCMWCNKPADEPHEHFIEVQSPICPDCNRELAHTNTADQRMLFSCMNINCDNYHLYLISGERAYKPNG